VTEPVSTESVEEGQCRRVSSLEEGCHGGSGRVRNKIRAVSVCFTGSKVGSRREAEEDVWAN